MRTIFGTAMIAAGAAGFIGLIIWRLGLERGMTAIAIALFIVTALLGGVAMLDQNGR